MTVFNRKIQPEPDRKKVACRCGWSNIRSKDFTKPCPKCGKVPRIVEPGNRMQPEQLARQRAIGGRAASNLPEVRFDIERRVEKHKSLRRDGR